MVLGLSKHIKNCQKKPDMILSVIRTLQQKLLVNKWTILRFMIFFIFQQQKPLLHIGTDKVHRYYIFQLVWRCKHDHMLRCSGRETKYNALVIHRCMYIHRIPMLSEFFFEEWDDSWDKISVWYRLSVSYGTIPVVWVWWLVNTYGQVQ